MNAVLRAVVYAHLCLAGVHLWAAWVLYGLIENSPKLSATDGNGKQQRYELVKKALA